MKPADRHTLLTFARRVGKLDFPESTIGFAGAFAMPHMVKIAAFLVPATNAPWGADTYWRNNVRESVRPRRPVVGRGALFCLFLYPNPNPRGASCH